MTVIASGLVHFYGPPGSGKTSLALTASDTPSKIVFLDGDASKGRQLAASMGIKHYHDMTLLGLEHQTELEYHIETLVLIDSLPDKMDVIIWDVPDEMFKGAHTFIHTHRADFRKMWAPLGPIAGAQEWIETRKTHLPRLYSKLLQKAKLVIFLSHEKPETDDTGIKTGLFIPDSDKSLEKKSALRIRLARNIRKPTDPAPIGLVTKSTVGYIEPKTRKITSVFPLRIAPCTWDKMKYYLDNPVGTRELTEEEIPDQNEYALISGVLTPEQKGQYEYYRTVQIRQIDTELTQSILNGADQYSGVGLNPLVGKVFSDLQGVYPDLTKDKVRDVIKNAQAEAKKASTEASD